MCGICELLEVFIYSEWTEVPRTIFISIKANQNGFATLSDLIENEDDY